LGMCWRIRGHLAEGYQWAQRLLEKGKDVTPIVRSKALSTTSCLLACILGNYEEAERMSMEALALVRESDDSYACAWAHFAVGTARETFDQHEARTNLQEALKLFRKA